MQREIFKAGSKTYYNSTRFFDEPTKQKIQTFYAFVRVVDDFVDTVPQQKEAFDQFEESYNDSRTTGRNSGNKIIDDFIVLSQRSNINSEWIDAFFASMKMDLHERDYKTIDDAIEYMYGSAEIIGLVMAKILNLPEKSFEYAKLLGRSMQYINFIRDIKEDTSLRRSYFPKSELQEVGLEKIDKESFRNDKSTVEGYVRKQIERYQEWQKEAEKGFKFIPKNYLVPIKTASDMYKWTAMQIYKNPGIVFEKKVKPSKIRIITTGIKNNLSTA